MHKVKRILQYNYIKQDIPKELNNDLCEFVAIVKDRYNADFKYQSVNDDDLLNSIKYISLNIDIKIFSNELSQTYWLELWLREGYIWELFVPLIDDSFKCYSKEVLIAKVYNDEKYAIENLIIGTYIEMNIDNDVLFIVRKVINTPTENNSLETTLYALLDSAYLKKIKPEIEQIKRNNTDSDISIVLSLIDIELEELEEEK